MVSAKQVINSTKPKIAKVPKGPTKLGSAGYDNVRDDIERTKSLREGTMEKVPVNDNDIANKKYVDDLDTAQTSARAMTKVLIDTYEGDDTNDREIDLGDDYDEIHIYLEEVRDYNEHHLAHVYIISNTYGSEAHDGTTNQVVHRAMSDANIHIQGKMTGADVNKIKLGSVGNSIFGTNYNGWTYRIIAKKYANVQTIPA